MDNSDPEDLFRPPNDSAYERDELRTGPPLDYVAEKLRSSLEQLHEAIAAGQPDTDLHRHCLASFHYGLIAFLALHNMLAIANDGDIVDRLAAYDRDSFDGWLDRIGQSGSVTG